MKIQLKPPRNLSKTIFFFFSLWVVGLIGMMCCVEARIAFTSDGMLEDNVLDWEPKIYVITADGKDIQQITYHDRGDWGAAWSPGGTQIVFASDRVAPVDLNAPPRILERSDIYVMSINHGKPIKLTQHPADDRAPAWSPDGLQIAFTSKRDGNSEIYVMNVDGSNPTRLTNHPGSDHNPTWSPDSLQIAFESDRIFRPAIFVMNADGTDIRQVTGAMEWNIEPAWSPGGLQIAFASDRNGIFDICIINVDGTGEKNLTNSKSEDRGPTWSPDGLQIAYSARQNGLLYDIYVMNADGRHKIALAKNLELAVELAWSPKPLAVSPKSKLSTLWGTIKIKQ